MLDNALPSSCDINLPSNAVKSLNSFCSPGPCPARALQVAWSGGTAVFGGDKRGGATAEATAATKPDTSWAWWQLGINPTETRAGETWRHGQERAAPGFTCVCASTQARSVPTPSDVTSPKPSLGTFPSTAEAGRSI